ncbi:MAG: tRNA (adenine-N1)-methyltransferase [Candidatus Hodarchaeaceae archaeon]|nr:tRNA (adenine-N1)-methyltransferase [Candidatus Hodarchaeaceae archaeon]
MIEEGERIILIDERGRKYLTRAERRQLQTNLGVVDLGEAVGKEPGAKLKSHLGNEFVLLRPSIIDYLQKLRRAPQIMLPKDAAQIVAYTGVGPGSLVVDAGVGSGSLAIFLGNLVRPDGRVVTYEIREDFARLAEENIRLAGLAEIVTVKLKDIYEGIDESDVDLVTLDLPQPERALAHAERALKPGGYLAVFTPCVEHIQRLYSEFPNFKFTNFKTIECLVREFEVKASCTRPSTRMIAHTGYLTFARRT